VPPPDPETYSYEQGEAFVEVGTSKPPRKMSRFKEHMSENGSRHGRSLSVGELDAPGSPGKTRQKSPNNKVWYKENASAGEQGDPFHGESL